ncbi:DNA mismatch endonuclease Vsr [Methylocella sp. CPCC 101449]|uniref:very short patch repair endonuclease n=1 Tax=Methylocella sp. CPCC 101449 TaxID=2987531 RepID=UPI002891730C|nr:DNA mismatch endonuclease Vsr [Methylocella sp. CPCC 101449]MDT2022828.1 DNA mismatch endonuclease Vsr [Methylocella sp. CPCC 101449]
MVDRLSIERRSWLMSRIKARDTTPELRVRRIAHSLGLRFRLHVKNLPGTPDLVFPRRSAAIFVHGCFWHRHKGCKKATMPKSHEEFWQTKFKLNVERDERAIRELEISGWRTLIIWQCQTRDPTDLRQILIEFFDLPRTGR